MDPLKIAAYCAFLVAWLVVAVAALSGLISRRHRESATEVNLTLPVIIGSVLQGVAALAVTWSLPDGRLQQSPSELIGALFLAPLGAAVFAWAMWSVPKTESGTAESTEIITTGCYRWLRHPMYLAFLALLVATGLLVSTGPALIGILIVYLIGSELRIAAEEAELVEKSPDRYTSYREQTRWRYLPGLR